MDIKLIKVRGFNLLLILFITLLLVLLIMTSMLFLSSSVDSGILMPSIVAAAILLLFCVPISIILYFSNDDKLSKRIFLALSATLFINTVSGIVWYLLPSSFNWRFLNTLGMFLMVLSYIPIIYALYITYKEQNANINKIFKIFIFYISLAFITLLLYFSLTSIKETTDWYTIIIFTCAIVFDVIIIALSAILILINLPTQLRYLFSIIFGFYSFSFMGDSLNLLEDLAVYTSPIDVQYFYDAMFIFASGTLLIYSLSNIKITTVEEMNKKLEDTSLVVEDLIMQSPDAMCMFDVNGTIIKANNLFRDLFKIAYGTSNIFNLSISNDTWFEKLKSGETITLDYVNNENTNKIRYLSLKIYPTFSSDKKISNYIFMGEDITIRKNAEDALKNSYDELENRVIERTAELSKVNLILQKEIQDHELAEERIKASLKEKDVLLKEIHHRVKNNMQIISSMLGLQSAYVEDETFNTLLKDSQGRIKSMALIHEKLYQSDNLAYINFTEYVNSLISYLKNSYNMSDDKIKINTNIEDMSLNIDMAIPLGLIINELISNSYKHAFKDNSKGEINLSINTEKSGCYLLTVEDNGVGLPVDFDISTTKSLGLQLVNVLVDQISGSLKIYNSVGAKFEISFKI